MKNLKIVIITTILVMIGALLVQLTNGAYQMSSSTILNAIFNSGIITNTTYLQYNLLGETLSNFIGIDEPNLDLISNEALIIWNIRIPRFILGLCVGINLALAGSIFQTITRNAMSSAYTLGISQGSGLSMLLILVLFPGLHEWTPFLAMIGGVVAFLIIYFMAWNGGTSPIRLVLSGVIIGSISIAIQKGLYYFISDIGVFQDILSWTTGSLIGLSWAHLRMIILWTIFGSAFSLFFYKPLDIMMLGDSNAKALGLSVERWRFIFAFVAILLASSAVAVAGLIGFVGLIVPHICRKLVGFNHKQLFISCIFVGSALLALSDVISRIILQNGQIPVGIILNTVGGIFFIVLMQRERLMR